MASVLGAILALIAFCLVTVLATLSYAVALPVFFLFALASAIWAGDTVWTGEIPSFGGERRKVAAETAASEQAAPRADGDRRRQADDRKRSKTAWLAPGSRELEVGWRSHPDRRAAVRSYYFGPVIYDVVGCVRAVWNASKLLVANGNALIEMAGDSDWAAVPVVANAGISTGLALGSFVGALIVVAFGMIYILVCLVTSCVAFCVGWMLRVLDSVMRFARGVTLTCLNCGCKVLPYPYYRCPGADCEVIHRDIRPSGYGILTRVCVCNARFPTMLVIGAGKLESICPRCKADLPRRFGRAAEIVVPIFGASNVGKTRLMYMLAAAFTDWVHDQGGKVIYSADASERLAAIKDSLRVSLHTEKTVPDTPRGLGFEIEIGLVHRLVTFFDAAGELFLREDHLAGMKFLNKARTYVHVADPLASVGLWQKLGAADQAKLEPFRASASAVAEVYQRTANQMLRMAPQREPPKLAFVISKIDLLRAVGLSVGDTSDEIKEWVSSDLGLDMEDIVRAASQRFAEVTYFTTAAVEEDGRVDESVMKLLRSMMRNIGIDIGDV